MADLEDIKTEVTKLVVHMENIKDRFDAIETERSKSKEQFWGKIDSIKEDVSGLKTEMSKMKIKIGGIVIVISTAITAGVNWILRKIT
jgi:archaellum component FlaC